ncbi:MAG TPA: hypothetical protein VMS77_09475 [Conexivisphaerales archaeon]|nr:hypothetical protein [Conexivisphaerales archaeon]
MKTILALIVALTLLSVSTPRTCVAQDIIPNMVAPPISFCIGQTTHCVMPDFNVNTVNYDLGAKKWDAGITTIGVGYALLFYSTEAWASGLAVHAAGQWSQSKPSYFAIIPTLVIAKYFEVGAKFSFMDGSIGKAITLGLGASLDVLTGQTMRARLSSARAARASQPGEVSP